MAFALPACQWCIKFTLACFTWVSFFLYSQGSFMGDVWDGIFCSLALRKVLCSLAEEKQQPCRMLATYPLVSYKLIFAGPSRTLSNPDSTRAQWGKGEKTHLFSRIMDKKKAKYQLWSINCRLIARPTCSEITASHFVWKQWAEPLSPRWPTYFDGSDGCKWCLAISDRNKRERIIGRSMHFSLANTTGI